ncbi:MAG: hypothetical protein H0T12_02195, partial [Actinobacteria bacterium]|nr:hypothetical protein [Actinomycetota bacterium]
MALLVTAGVVLWTTTRPERAEPIRMDHSQDAAGNGETKARTPSRQEGRPTKAEAKNIFHKLQGLVKRATQERDLSVLSNVLSLSGTSFEPASESIRKLLRDGVLDETKFRSIDVRVLEAGRRRIRIKEERRLFPCFVTEDGVDVTQGPPAVRQVTVWSIQRVEEDWLIESAE